MLFSPDSNIVAYTWRDATYIHSWTPGVRPRTITDALQVCWFPIGFPEKEKSIPLDSIDLRPDGKTYYNLYGELCFSPDSKNLAAVCANYIIIIDIKTGDYSKLHYEGEWFDSLRWLSGQEIVFSTKYDKKIIFWRLNITDNKNSRTKIYEQEMNYSTSDNLPPRLHPLLVFSFSPNAKYVLFTIPNNNKLAVKLLNLETGHTRIFPISVCRLAWKPDATELLLHQFDEQKFYMIEMKTMEITDLTSEFLGVIDKNLDMHLAAPLWTPDGKHIVIYSTAEIPKRFGGFRFKHTGYLIQLRPFKVILSTKGIIRRSPISGWAFLQGDNDFEWIDHTGTKAIKLDGWPNNWVWSPNGQLASRIKEGKVVVFKPKLPIE